MALKKELLIEFDYCPITGLKNFRIEEVKVKQRRDKNGRFRK